MDQSFYPFHINAAPVERGDHVRLSTARQGAACYIHTAVSTCRLLTIEKIGQNVAFYPIFFDQKD